MTVSVISNYRAYSLSQPPEALQEQIVFGLGLIWGALLFCGHSRVMVMLAASSGMGILWLDGHTNNHEMLYSFVSLTMVGGYLSAAFRERRIRIDFSAYQQTLAGLLRLTFFAFYFWVVFHKLNPQFFDAGKSCAGHELGRLGFALPALAMPDFWIAKAGYLTLAAEVSIPLLLISKRTRRVGVLLGLGFHSVLSVGYPAFQFFVIGFLALFVPSEALANLLFRPLKSFADRWALSSATAFGLRMGAGVVIALLSQEFAQLRWQGDGRILGHSVYPGLALALSGLVLVRFAIKGLRHAAWNTQGTLFVQRTPVVLWLFPIAVWSMGLQPHLGIKNVQSYSMFSNLDTGNGQSNHFLVPASWQISDNLSDVVKIEASNVRAIRAFGSQRRMLGTVLKTDEHPEFAQPFVELKRLVTQIAERGRRGITIEYSRSGEQISLNNAETDPELTGASFFERRYLKLRPIALSHHGACRW